MGPRQQWNVLHLKLNDEEQKFVVWLALKREHEHQHAGKILQRLREKLVVLKARRAVLGKA
jgi:hypothetical protein